MFHGRRLLGEARTDSPGLWDRDKYSALDWFMDCLDDAFVLQGKGPVQALRGSRKFPAFRASRIAQVYRKRGNAGSNFLRRGAVVSGMIRPRFILEIA
jgi:hypothetical protein